MAEYNVDPSGRSGVLKKPLPNKESTSKRKASDGSDQSQSDGNTLVTRLAGLAPSHIRQANFQLGDDNAIDPALTAGTPKRRKLDNGASAIAEPPTVLAPANAHHAYAVGSTARSLHSSYSQPDQNAFPTQIPAPVSISAPSTFLGASYASRGSILDHNTNDSGFLSLPTAVKRPVLSRSPIPVATTSAAPGRYNVLGSPEGPPMRRPAAAAASSDKTNPATTARKNNSSRKGQKLHRWTPAEDLALKRTGVSVSKGQSTWEEQSTNLPAGVTVRNAKERYGKKFKKQETSS